MISRLDRSPLEASRAETAEKSGNKVSAVSLPGGSDDTHDTPIGEKWWPSKWGAEDQRGAANLMTAEKVLEAQKLIKSGQVYQLGRVYERDMPTFSFRTFRLTIPALVQNYETVVLDLLDQSNSKHPATSRRRVVRQDLNR